MSLRKITSGDMAGKGISGLPDVPGLPGEEMRRRLEELVADVVVHIFNQNVDNTYSKTQTQSKINEAVFHTGAADMTKHVYDPENMEADVFMAANHKMAGYVRPADAQEIQETDSVLEAIGNVETRAVESLASVLNASAALDGGTLIITSIITPSKDTYAVRFEWPSGDISDITIDGTEITEVFILGTEDEAELSIIPPGVPVEFTRQGERAFFKMGGGLNYRVIAAASEEDIPASAAEKTVAVITNSPITGHVFSSTEPDNPLEGYIWFLTADSSPASMRIGTKNGAMVCPVAALQWNGTGWVYKVAQTMLNGVWKSWWLPLYTFGTQNVGWSSGYISGGGTVQYNDSNILLSMPSSGGVTVRTTEARPTTGVRQYLALVSVESVGGDMAYVTGGLLSTTSQNPEETGTKAVAFYPNAFSELGKKYPMNFPTRPDATQWPAIMLSLTSSAKIHAVFEEPAG